MNNEAYQRSRLVRHRAAQALARRTQAPWSVRAWIQDLDAMEAFLNQSSWPVEVPEEVWDLFVDELEDDFEWWCLSDAFQD